MDYNEFVKSWNPPSGFKTWLANGLPPEGDSMVCGFKEYRFPWYRGHQWLWHGLRCWWKTGEWPERILYFKKSSHKDLYLKILRENGLL